MPFFRKLNFWTTKLAMCEGFIVSDKSRQSNMQVCCHVGLDLTTIQYSSPHSLKWILPQAKSSKNSRVNQIVSKPLLQTASDAKGASHTRIWQTAS